MRVPDERAQSGAELPKSSRVGMHIWQRNVDQKCVGEIPEHFDVGVVRVDSGKC